MLLILKRQNNSNFGAQHTLGIKFHWTTARF